MNPLVRLVLPAAWTAVFAATARYFDLALRQVGYEVELAEGRLSRDASWNLVLGWGVHKPSIPDGARYVIYQQEPLALAEWRERVRREERLLRGAEEIWEYSTSNLHVWEGFNHVRWAPLRSVAAARSVQGIDLMDSLDVLFVGNLTPRRHAVLKRLSERCLVSVQPYWGDDRDRAFRRAKIVLNIHQFSVATPLEQPRVVQAVDSGCCVVTEACCDRPYPGLGETPYEDLEARVMELLLDTTQRRQVLLSQREAMDNFGDLAEWLAGIDLTEEREGAGVPPA